MTTKQAMQTPPSPASQKSPRCRLIHHPKLATAKSASMATMRMNPTCTGRRSAYQPSRLASSRPNTVTSDCKSSCLLMPSAIIPTQSTPQAMAS